MASSAIAHLDENDGVAVTHDQVDFTQSAMEVFRQRV